MEWSNDIREYTNRRYQLQSVLLYVYKFVFLFLSVGTESIIFKDLQMKHFTLFLSFFSYNVCFILKQATRRTRMMKKKTKEHARWEYLFKENTKGEIDERIRAIANDIVDTLSERSVWVSSVFLCMYHNKRNNI